MNFLCYEWHRFLVSWLQHSELHVQRGVVGNVPHGVEPILEQLARACLCQYWCDANDEILKSCFTEVDSIVKYPRGLWGFDLFERWPWCAVD